MELHPGPEKSRVSTVKLAELEPIQQALHDNEDWYQDLVEHSQDLLCVHDLEGRLLLVNPAPARVLGYSVEEILQIPMRDLVAPEFRDEFDAYLRRIESLGEASGLLAVMTRSGERRIWEYHNTLRREGVTTPIVRGLAHDVTEQKRAEKLAREASEDLIAKARESEHTIRELKLFRTLVDQSNDAIEVVDPLTLRFLDVNEKACSVLGYSREELLTLGVFDINPVVTKFSTVKIKEELRNSGSFVMETVHRRKDGSTFPVEVSMRRVQLERDYVITISRDITERKRTEDRLREYERVVEGLEEVIAVVDRDYRYVIANRAFLNLRGMEKEQVIGRLVPEVINKEDFEKVFKPKLDECFKGRVVRYQMTYDYPKAGKREIFASYFPIEGAKEIDRIAAVVQDITEHTRAQEALRRSEEKYRNFVSQSSEGIYRDDLAVPVPIDLPEDELIRRFLHDTVMVECNDAMASMYGFISGEELRGRRMSERMVPEDQRNIELAREFIRSGFRLLERESHEVDRYGNPKIFLNSMIGTLEDGKLVRVWGIQRDITEKVKLEESRRKADEALRENVGRLQEVTEELRLAKEKLSEEKLYLEESIDTELGFGEIIGRSGAMKEVMEKVAKVAPSDATVLLLGETGTGKELVARALHRMSHREGNSFIKLNCAAIPSGLLESELFGHEKGAFTGAVTRKLGRLELADQGTLFLDEVGEIPLSLQPKLLRVLQDLEFERLGGTQTLKVNFRLLAATNRDLQQSVKAREFRSDLYYRVNVFPIVIPPLRERREDIRPLVEHFVRKFAVHMKKSITSIPSKTMEMLVRWDWPGNIRELENFVERSVILTPGSVLQAPLAELHAAVDLGAMGSNENLRDKERERILRALRDCHGKLGGPDGAAARLGLKRTTLQSKLDQLGIKPGGYRARRG
jgi:formate hydrogenlyase transcriptional activator